MAAPDTSSVAGRHLGWTCVPNGVSTHTPVHTHRRERARAPTHTPCDTHTHRQTHRLGRTHRLGNTPTHSEPVTQTRAYLGVLRIGEWDFVQKKRTSLRPGDTGYVAAVIHRLLVVPTPFERIKSTVHNGDGEILQCRGRLSL